jgi:hypothetical protein
LQKNVFKSSLKEGKRERKKYRREKEVIPEKESKKGIPISAALPDIMLVYVQHAEHQSSPVAQLHLPNHTQLKQAAGGSCSSSISRCCCLNAHHLHRHSIRRYNKKCETTEKTKRRSIILKINSKPELRVITV